MIFDRVVDTVNQAAEYLSAAAAETKMFSGGR